MLKLLRRSSTGYAKDGRDHDEGGELLRDGPERQGDKEVSQLAGSVLPTLEEHLKMAQASKRPAGRVSPGEMWLDCLQVLP